jgi:hypothetical protein
VCSQHPVGVTIPEDVVRRESNYAYSERLKVRRQRRHAWITARSAVMAQGEDTPSEPESSGEDDKEKDKDGEEGEVTPPPPFSVARRSSLAG